MLQQMGHAVPPAPASSIPEVASPEEGRAILLRVKIAISKAVYDPEVAIERIRPMAGQPRKYFNPVKMDSMVDSMKTAGQVMPGFLRTIDVDVEGRDRELLDGERRWRALTMAQFPTFRAMVVEIDDIAAQYAVALIANFNREGHTILEIADGIRVAKEKLKLTEREIHDIIGYSVGYIGKLYNLRKLHPDVRSMLEHDVTKNKKLPITAAFDISELPLEDQVRQAQRVLNRQVSMAMLRTEVEATLVRKDLPIRKKEEDPHHQRQALERRAVVVRKHAADFRNRFESTSMKVVGDWNSGNMLATRADLVAALADLSAARESFADLVAACKSIEAAIEAFDFIDNSKKPLISVRKAPA